MNKDLDDRLVPPGEYRDGQNIQISRSEGASVGALENVLGNNLITDFNIPLGCCNVEVIGRYMDVTNDRIFVFQTNFIDNSINGLDNRYIRDGTTSYYSAISVYNIKTGVSQVLVGGLGLDGAFLNFAKNYPIHHINMIDELLFWTDNRNQPRKINVNNALADSTYYSNEDHVSVAKYYPYKVARLISEDSAGNPAGTMVNKVDPLLPDEVTPNPYYDPNWNGDPNFIKDKFLRFSYRFKFDDGENSLMAPYTQTAFIPKQDGYFIGKLDTTDPNKVGKDDEDITFQSTEVRFFQNKVNQITLIIESPDGIPFNELYTKLKVVGIDILYKESDGLSCKVVETLPREVFENGGLDPVTGMTTPASAAIPNTTGMMEYVYNSAKPYKTLPQKDTTRVYDKVPIRAAAQEISGNRVIYGNFVNKHTPPSFIDYNVLISEKEDKNFYLPEFNINSKIEYPNNTLKQNRTYQVGIVLADRYGRQSSVLLSSVDSGQTPSNILYGGSTVFHRYNSPTQNPILNPGTDYSWPGDALRVLFNNVLVTNSEYNHETGEPGVYDEITNPLGWYSYKVVVKQQEQDYYNIYFPGILNGGVTDGNEEAASENQPFAHIVLQGDNINKVPRDLVNISPDQKVYRTSRPTKVENPMWYSVLDAEGATTEVTFSDWNSLEARNFVLQRNIDLGLTEPDTGSNASLGVYLRVDNDGISHTGHENRQHDPERSQDMVVNIGTGTDLGLWDAGDFPTYIYNPQSNPLCARLEVEDPLVGIPSDTKIPILAVYETEPEVSRLRLFWETSTTGLIHELNEAIQEANLVVVDPNDPTGSSWATAPHSFTEDRCPWPAFASSYAFNNQRNQVSSVFQFINNQGQVIGQGTGGAYIQLQSAWRKTSPTSTWSPCYDFSIQMWWPGYDGSSSTPPPGIPDAYQAFLVLNNTFWFSKDDFYNSYRFVFTVTDAGSTSVVELYSSTRNSIPFAGWVPTGLNFTNWDGEGLNVPGYFDNSVLSHFSSQPSLLTYEDPKPPSGVPNIWDPGPSYNYPQDWVDGGWPFNGTALGANYLNINQASNNEITNTVLSQYITPGVANWLRLPIGNGSWFDGRRTYDFPQWVSDNYTGRADNSGEMNLQIISQTLVRHTNMDDPNSPLEEYTSVNNVDIDYFYLNDNTDSQNPEYPYGMLKSNFENCPVGDYVDGDVFKITIRYTDCWDPNATQPIVLTPNNNNLQTL
ncbi:MAG TPA: hypothetical protein QF753_23025 [Victivallales bacterium]|nr:hypothetical protein [Victivallales bacterium]